MKKSFISLGLIVAATFALTNCAKEFENPSQQPESAGIPFEITASTPDTKTANDGLNTVWAADDAINLFHAEAETAEYVNDGKFTIAEADVDAGRFTGTLGSNLDAGNSYDWYAFYPYSNYTTTPANISGGRTYIGCRSDESQEQVGLDNMDHIEGVNYPLYGYIKSVSADVKPTLAMTHVSSLIEVVVTNTLSEELNVEDISFTAPEDIVGNYYINFAEEECSFTKYYTYQSNTALLEVSDAVIPAGGKGKFYLAIKPFDAESGSVLKLSVNGYEKPLTLPKDVTFAAGKIKTLNFGYDKVVEVGTEEVEIVSSSLGVNNSDAVTSINDGLVTFAKGTNSSTAPAYYTSGSAIRMYTGNTLTVTAPSGYLLTRIAFEFVSDQYATSLTCVNSNAYVDGVWTGELNEVVFKVTGSEQTRITKIYITYKEGEMAPSEVEYIEAVDPKTEYFVGGTFEEPVVNAVYSNSVISPIDGAVFTGYDMMTPGEQTVTVTYDEFSTTYTITVSEPEGDSYSLYSGDLVEGDYIIVYDGGAMKASVTSNRLDYMDVDIINDVIYEPDAAIVWHIAKSGDYWTIYNESVSKYAASTGANNKAQLLSSGTDDKSLWKASGTEVYEFVNKANTGNKNLRRNGNYGFACYSPSTGGALSLYKKN